jgi:hypothetical protein
MLSSISSRLVSTETHTVHRALMRHSVRLLADAMQLPTYQSLSTASHAS